MNSPTPPPPTEAKPLRILHVEDEPVDHRALLRHVQEQHLPYEVTWAVTLAAARAKLAEQPFDLVVTDYHLPDGFGPSLRASSSDLPFILITGTLHELLTVRTLQQGMDDYLIKDVEQRYLAALPDAVTKARHRWVADQSLRRALDQLAQELAEQERLNAELKQALAQVKLLRGLLPICGYCKKLRHDKDYWEKVLAYAIDGKEPHFNHDICPDCLKAHAADFADKPPEAKQAA